MPAPIISGLYRKEDIVAAQPTLRGKCAIVIDVLRATTTMITALSNGAACVRVAPTIDEAKAVAQTLPAGSFVIAGERGGIKLPEFEFGNSPRDFSRERIGGKTIVLTTTNGTIALCESAKAGAAQILIGALVNARAVAAKALQTGLDVVLVGAGSDGSFGDDDCYTAGVIIAEILKQRPDSRLHDSAREAHVRVATKATTLQGILESGPGAVLTKLGAGIDIQDCAMLNVYDLAPVFDSKSMTVNVS